MEVELQNANPTVYAKQQVKLTAEAREALLNDAIEDPVTSEEIYALISDITDPEHPLTLQQLNVVSTDLVLVEGNRVTVRFTPTIPHCSMATLIGLCIRVQLTRCLAQRFKVTIRVTEGTHASEKAVNKQLNDKERVAAAMENTHLLKVVSQCLSNSLNHE
jgi:metal-sulfur cluster biosynthetic enzyme